MFCTSIRVEQKQTVMHYQPQASLPFLRIGLSTPNLVPQCKGAPLPHYSGPFAPPDECFALS